MGIEERLISSLQKELNLTTDQLEVVGFGYRLLIYSIWGYLFIILLAYLFNTVQVTLTAAITASLFRIFSGGAHASTQKRCVVVGAIIFNVLGLISSTYHPYLSVDQLRGVLWVVAILAFISFILYSPADTPGKPISSEVQKKKLRSISILLLIGWFILFNFVIKGETDTNRQYLLATSLGLAWQSVSLWPLTYRWAIFK